MGRPLHTLSRRATVLLLVVGACLVAVPEAMGHGILRREGDTFRYEAFNPRGFSEVATLTVSSPSRGFLSFLDLTTAGGFDWGPCLPLTLRHALCRQRTASRVRIAVFQGPDVVRAKVSLAIDVDAGDGADRVTGGFGDDLLQGGPDDDLLTGGLGRDSVAGGPGDDRIEVRDGRADQVSCGEGVDVLFADQEGVDEIDPLELPACEQVRRAVAPPDRRDPGLTVTAPARKRPPGGLPLAVSMSEPGSFVATGQMRIAGRLAGRLRPARGRPNAPGQRWKVALGMRGRLAKAAERALDRGKMVVVGTVVRARDRSGNVTVARRVTTLRNSSK